MIARCCGAHEVFEHPESLIVNLSGGDARVYSAAQRGKDPICCFVRSSRTGQGTPELFFREWHQFAIRLADILDRLQIFHIGYLQ